MNLVIYTLVLCLVANAAAKSSWGVQTLFKPNTKKMREEFVSRHVVTGDQRDCSSDVLEFSIEAPKTIDDLLYTELMRDSFHLIANYLQKSDTTKGEAKFGKDHIVVSHKSITGYTTSVFLNTPARVIKSTKKTGSKKKPRAEIEMSSVTAGSSNSKHSGKGPSCQLTFKATMLSDRSLQLQISCTSQKISKADKKWLLALLRDLWTQRVLDALGVVSSRLKMSSDYQKKASAWHEEKKALRLDRVINPDKYKSHSPTVRREGQRFSPADGARERMQAKRRVQVVRRGG